MPPKARNRRQNVHNNNPAKKNQQKQASTAKNTSVNSSANNSADEQEQPSKRQVNTSSSTEKSIKKVRISGVDDMDQDISDPTVPISFDLLPELQQDASQNAAPTQLNATATPFTPESQNVVPPSSPSNSGNPASAAPEISATSLSAEQQQTVVPPISVLENAPDPSRSRHDPFNTDMNPEYDIADDPNVAIVGDVT